MIDTQPIIWAYLAGILTTVSVGILTTVIVNYWPDRLTNARWKKKSTREQDRLWKDIERRFPKIISQMREDVFKPGFEGARIFFAIHSGDHINISEPHFKYYTDEHPDLKSAIAHLKDHELVMDITSGNTPKYRMNELFVDLLRRLP